MTMLPQRFETDVVTPTLLQCYSCNLEVTSEFTFFPNPNTTLSQPADIDVVIPTLQQRCCYTLQVTSERTLPSNLITTFQQRCETYVVISTLPQHCLLVARRRDLDATFSQRCGNVVCLLGSLNQVKCALL